MFKISKEERQLLLKYLQNRPYADVYQLIAIIVGLRPLEDKKEDKKENGKDTIILRELENHECFYVGNIEDAVEKLKDYPITEDEIKFIYQKNYAEKIESYY